MIDPPMHGVTSDVGLGHFVHGEAPLVHGWIARHESSSRRSAAIIENRRLVVNVPSRIVIARHYRKLTDDDLIRLMEEDIAAHRRARGA
jgi:hypothetical protein